MNIYVYNIKAPFGAQKGILLRNLPYFLLAITFFSAIEEQQEYERSLIIAKEDESP